MVACRGFYSTSELQLPSARLRERRGLEGARRGGPDAAHTSGVTSVHVSVCLCTCICTQVVGYLLDRMLVEVAPTLLTPRVLLR